MQKRLFIFVCALVSVIFIGFSVFSITFINNSQQEEMIATLNSECSFLSSYLGEVEDYDQMAREIYALTNRRATFVGPQGSVLGDSMFDPLTMENHLTRPEIAEAQSTGRGSAIRQSASTSNSEAYVAVKMDDGVILRLSMQVDEIHMAAARTWGLLVGVAFALYAVSLFVAYRIAKKMVGPVKTITKGARAISEGNYDVTIDVDTGDELGELAETFNMMSARLKRTIEQVETDKTNLETLLSSMTDGVVAVDNRMNLIFLNRAAQGLLKIKQVQVGSQLLESVRQPALEETLNRALLGEKADAEVLVGVSHVRTLRISTAPVRRNHAITGAVALISNVTKIRRLERMRSDFVANVSHELKTPVTSIKGFAQTLQTEGIDENTRKHFLSIIDGEADRLIRLIDDILSLSAIESEETKGQRATERVDLDAVADRTVKLLRPKAEEKGLILQYSPEAAPAYVTGKELNVEQIILNLVDNAIKYTEQGRVDVAIRREEGKLALHVKDTGIGIPQEHLPRIFERFYRVDKGRSRQSGGTGLGLAIVKHLAALLEGSVELFSQPGEGTEFIVRLPETK